MDISLAGLVGAIVGTMVAGVNYHLFIGLLDRAIRARTPSTAEAESAEITLSLIRRLVLTVDLFVFAALGYWIGQTFWG
jgi:hypothetical protein